MIVFNITCLECHQHSQHIKKVSSNKGYPLEYVIDQLRCPLCGSEILHVIVDSKELRDNDD